MPRVRPASPRAWAVAGLLKREGLLHLDGDLTGVDQARDRGQRRAVRLDQVRSDAHAGRLGGLGQFRGDTGRDGDQQATGTQDLERAGAGLVMRVAHQVDDDVDVGGGVLETGGGVVDGLVGAEFLEPGVAGGAGGGDHVGAQVPGELDREVAHPMRRRP